MSKQSRIEIVSGFHALKLNNDRDIYVYLPPSYDEKSSKHYQVLYMHDGQNIFRPAAMNGQCWNVHTTADRLIDEGLMKEIIIVGISNMEIERYNEYFLYAPPFEEIPVDIKNRGLVYKGLLYEDFIINDLKPYIDSHFRTMKDSAHTALLGSSMGGLITYNIGTRNPDVFGKLGVISPYFTHTDIYTDQETNFYKILDNSIGTQKIWIDIGEAEGLIAVNHARDVVDAHIQRGECYGRDIAYYCVPGAGHSENDWAQRIHAPLLYFFGDIGKPVSVQLFGRNIVGLKGMKVRANPVVYFDSGFVKTDLDGEYKVNDSGILEIMRDGTIIPKAEGTTKVTYILDSLEISKDYTVIGELPEKVSVAIHAELPKDAPDGAELSISHYLSYIELKESGERHYACNFTVPRDIEFADGMFNINVAGCGYFKTIIGERLKAENELEINYKVEG